MNNTSALITQAERALTEAGIGFSVIGFTVVQEVPPPLSIAA